MKTTTNTAPDLVTRAALADAAGRHALADEYRAMALAQREGAGRVDDAARVSQTASKLLAAARSTNLGRPEGTVRHARAAGDVLVTWDRVAKLYDVGTDARSIATGRRGDVLPALETLLAS
jgi:hypothetical protein